MLHILLHCAEHALKDSILSVKEMLSLIPQIFRTSIVGGFIGFLPGAGGTTASFLSYMMERKINKNRHLMGTDQGSIQGVSAVEASNNSASVGAFSESCARRGCSVEPQTGQGSPSVREAAIMPACSRKNARF